MDDVLGLVVLAVVSDLGQGGSDRRLLGVARATGISIGFLVVALLVGMPLGKRLIAIVGRANVRGMLVRRRRSRSPCFWPSPAEKAGSAAIVGAFAMGLVLARTNRRHDIDHALKPVVDIFAPVFFVSVGAQVDVTLLNPFAAGEPAGPGPRAGADGDRLPRQVSGGILRLGQDPTRFRRRGDGSARRGRA